MNIFKKLNERFAYKKFLQQELVVLREKFDLLRRNCITEPKYSEEESFLMYFLKNDIENHSIMLDVYEKDVFEEYVLFPKKVIARVFRHIKSLEVFQRQEHLRTNNYASSYWAPVDTTNKNYTNHLPNGQQVYVFSCDEGVVAVANGVSRFFKNEDIVAALEWAEQEGSLVKPKISD